jgi:hypothetical protein
LPVTGNAGELQAVGNRAGPGWCVATLTFRRSRDENGVRTYESIGIEEPMSIKYQLSVFVFAAVFFAIGWAFLRSDKIGEGLILGVLALMSVRYWARRRANAHLGERPAGHGDRMD